MRLSEYFLPLLRENPSEAQIVSHRLMLRAGMIRQSSAGIYSWLPLGLRVLKKVERIVREEQDRTGALEILMPTVQPAELWRESGRYDDYGKEMLRIRDRHDREMLYGPTNEEQVTEIVRASIKSYRDLPKLLYHIQWKFRDEVRPRFGVMRGREFLMKDAYSFDLDFAGARHSYNKMFVAYLRTFARMGLKAIPMRADTGPIGGDLSHEFIILADTGESAVHVHSDFLETDWQDFDSVGWEASALQQVVDHYTSIYAATDEVHDPQAAARYGDKIVSKRGIEVARNGVLRHRRVASGRRADRSKPRRCRDNLAAERCAVPPRPDQSAARRRQVPRGCRRSLCQAARRRARGALRRSRRIAGRQIRDNGSDRPAGAARHRPAQPRRRYGRDQRSPLGQTAGRLGRSGVQSADGPSPRPSPRKRGEGRAGVAGG
jgi:hypothetical protein